MTTRRATISDVAALAGVSVAAVSKTVNGKGNISEATRARIMAAATKLQWAPSAAAVALRNARTRAIGMVARRSPDLLSTDPHFTELISGIEGVLSPRGYGLLLHIVGEQPQAEEDAYRQLAEQRRVDGVVLTESRIGDSRFDLLRDLGLPAVLVGTPWRTDPIPSVQAADQHDGLSDAVGHLLSLGHTRIAYVSGPEDRVHTSARRRAVQAALREHGIPPSHQIVSDFTAAGAANTVDELLSTGVPPTAVFFANDTMAAAAAGEARRRGIDVPGDLSIIGHDDLPLASLIYPALTTVRQDLTGLGRAAALSLLKALGVAADDDVTIESPKLVIRESTGPAQRR